MPNVLRWPTGPNGRPIPLGHMTKAEVEQTIQFSTEQMAGKTTDTKDADKVLEFLEAQSFLAHENLANGIDPDNEGESA